MTTNGHKPGLLYRWPESVRATCTCGWEGPEREWSKEALADGRAHELEEHVYKARNP